jgi:protein TonB
MTLTWQNDEPHGARGTVRLRLLSLALAGLICVSLVYLAATRRFQVIADLFSDPGAISVVVVDDPLPPPPPPLPQTDPPPLQQQSVAINPLAPPTATFDQVVQVEQPAELVSRHITGATFLQRPSGRDFERYFPTRALARGQSGRVVLDCTVAVDGRIACAVESEDPAGWGFGEASLRAASHFRVAPATADGQPTSGGRLRVPMTWRVN